MDSKINLTFTCTSIDARLLIAFYELRTSFATDGDMSFSGTKDYLWLLEELLLELPNVVDFMIDSLGNLNSIDDISSRVVKDAYYSVKDNAA